MSTRLLALMALALAVLAVGVTVASSLGGNEGSGTASPAATTSTSSASSAGGPRQSSYRVKAGDTLSAIAEKTGVTVEELMQLNPEVDPQSLRTGQKLQLRAQ